MSKVKGRSSKSPEERFVVASKVNQCAVSGTRNSPKKKVYQLQGYGEITIKEFFDFISCAYKLDKELKKSSEPTSSVGRCKVIWSDLETNKLISKLLGLSEKAFLKAARENEKISLNKGTISSEVIAMLSEPITRTVSTQCSGAMALPNTDLLSNLEKKQIKTRGQRHNSKYSYRLVKKDGATNFDFVRREVNREEDEEACEGEDETEAGGGNWDYGMQFSEHILAQGEGLITEKLESMFDEEIFDSILPYFTPKYVGSDSGSKSSEFQGSKKSTNSEKSTQQKSRHTMSASRLLNLPDTEVEIHVRDEIKNQRKDFKCGQRILIEKMGYFAQVTGGQKLEDMDISVHCDIGVFEWIMNWVKKDPNDTSGWPELDIFNVVPVLVSAAFLQIDPLVNNCMKYFKEKIETVINSGTNLTCINDHVLKRLADMFTNSELECIVDKKDKIVSRLYCKFIMSLVKEEPEKEKGHYSSLAFLRKCKACERLIHYEIGRYILCVPKNLRMDTNGNLQGHHDLDSNWSVSKFIQELKSEFRSWRKVYWRLWGECHFLFCTSCHTYYPAIQSKWCPYHSQPVQFLAGDSAAGTPPCRPKGYYTCCGQKTSRFEPLPITTGCKFKRHTDHRINDDVQGVSEILRYHEAMICSDPITKSPQKKPEMILMWRSAVMVVPKSHLSLIPLDSSSEDIIAALRNGGGEGNSREAVLNEERRKLLQKDQPDNSEYDESSSLGDGEDNSDESPGELQTLRKQIRGIKRCKYWCPDVPTRYNQDNQRDGEEKKIKRFIKHLTMRGLAHGRGIEPRVGWSAPNSDGGIYTHLEQEWRGISITDIAPNSASTSRSGRGCLGGSAGSVENKGKQSSRVKSTNSTA